MEQPEQKDGKKESLRLFTIGYALLINLKFDLSVRYTTKALSLNPQLTAGHYNNACAATLAGDEQLGMHHLQLLAESLKKYPNQYLMKS